MIQSIVRIVAFHCIAVDPEVFCMKEKDTKDTTIEEVVEDWVF